MCVLFDLWVKVMLTDRIMEAVSNSQDSTI